MSPALLPQGRTAPKPMDRTLTSDHRPCSPIFPTANAFWSPDKNPGSSPRLIRITPERSFGRRELATAARPAGCNGVSPPMTARSMSRCPTSGSASRRLAPLGRKLAFNPKISLLLDSKTGGGLSALRLDTGEEVWRTPHPGCGDVPGCSPAQSAAVTAIPGLVFSGGLDGWLRAYSAEDGRIVWSVDTKGDYQTVNGVQAKGGSIDGGGAVVVDGMVYIGSGSGFAGTMPGNVLLAYSVDGL